MNFSCPHCGGEIILVPGTEPPPGWRNSAQSGSANQAQMSAQTATQTGFAGLSETSSTERTKAYNRGYDQGFLVFWKVYPLKRDKRKAQNAWRNAISRATANAILDGAKRYRDDPNRLAQFTKYAEGWLNGDGWEDEPLPPRIDRNVRPPDPPRPYDPLVAEIEMRDAMEEARRHDG